jgi:uncharacterized protein (DUF302 family)
MSHLPNVARPTDAGVAVPNQRPGEGNGSKKPADGGDGLVVTKSSPWSMADTVARLSAVVAARGMKVFAVIDHSDEARRVGLTLRDTKLFIVGSASASAAAIAAAPLAALDLPLRVVVWEDGFQTKVSYPSPTEVARRYGLDNDLAAALGSIETVTSVVVDR